MTHWQQTLVDASSSIRHAIEVIDTAKLQIALIADDDGRLLGTLTDGDVRRAILRGVSLDGPVSDVMNANPKTARRDDDPAVLLSIMRQHHIHQVPLLDPQWRIVGLETFDHLNRHERRPNTVVLMAGGLGTRLLPLTNEMPKPLLHVGHKPILETILEVFVEHGFERFFLSVNYMAEKIESHFGDGSKWGVEIEYLRETERLGTAGALSLLPERPQEPLFVMNGDLLTRLDFSRLLEFHTTNASAATMCVREYEMQVPYGVVKTDGHRIVEIEEKPVERYLVNGGVYVLEPETLDLIPNRTFFDMPDLFSALAERQAETCVFPIREYWMDIGRMEDFDRANGQFAQQFQ
jgi:dTDP-glucose pyrophosphorylase